MKCILVLTLIVTAAYGLTKEDLTNLKAKTLEDVEACQKESGATDDDLAQLMKKQLPTTKGGKCFIFCAHKKIGIQNPDGKKNPAGVEALIKEVAAVDADLSEKIKQIALKCNSEVDDSGDPCETAVKMAECCTNTSKQMGIQVTF